MKLIDKRGGTNEMLHLISPYTNRTRIAQMALVGIGLVFYFDSLTSILVVGTIFGSIIKGFPISCEKLSFIVHSTALPLASIIPGSTWIVQTSNLLQHELDKVAILDDTMETTGKSMIINSIKYQFYPILMLALVFILLMADRDAGPLLGAENRARSNYAIVEKNMDALFSRRGMGSREERSWNWWIPVAILTGSLWYTFVRISGAAEDANIYSISSALMVCPTTTAVLVQLLFFFQTQIRGSLGCCGYHEKSVKENVTFLSDTFPSASTSKSDVEQRHDEMESQKQTETLKQNSSSRHVDMSGRSDESEGTTSRPRSHIEEVVGCLIGGMNSCAQIFVALIFTWAASGMFTELGVGRLVVSWILEDSVSHEVLPIVAYCSALLLSLMLGNALRTVSILIPALTVPLYQSIGGNSVTFVVTLASILSGAITGDHIGPFSDTTILSGLVSGGDTRCHFITQAPYAIFVLVVSVGTGVVPMSYDVYPDFVGYLVGLGIFVAFVILACRKVDMPPIVLGRAAEAITQTLHKNIEVGRRENLSVIHSPDNYETLIIGESEDDPSTRTEEHCKQVYTSESIAATEKVDNTQTALSLKSFKSKLKDVTESGRDPIEGLVEIGILHRNVRSELYGHGRNIPRSGGGRFIGSSHSEADFAPMAIIQNKKKLIEATIKKAENDGNIFSDSLRMFLRSAEKKIDSLMDEESLEIQASESNEVSLDDSLDHLMSGIASNDWRVAVDALQGSNHDDDADGSTRGDYSTDGASSGVESDDSASASSSSSAGKSTAFTGDGATAYTVDGESTSRATSVGPSIATAEFSDLKSPLEFGKSRKVLPAWLDGEMSVASSCSDVRESRASF
jgi:Na+/H+ antiporter NhaC